MNKNINFLLALLIADALFDTLFLSAILAPSSTEDEDEHPLIGRRYKPMDNSYIKDLESGVDSGVGLYGKEVIIVSDPYVDTIKDRICGDYERLFVDVFSTDSGRKYRVLFNEGWLIDEEK